MKKTMMFLGVLSLELAHAQQGRVGINTDEPKATLQVKSISPDEAKGVLIPQLAGDKLREMTANLVADQHGLITFATNGVTTLDNIPTNNVQFAGYHRFNVDGSNKSWVRLEPSGLEKIKGEGTNTGWRLILPQSISQYASKIGKNAVDLSIHTSNRYLYYEGFYGTTPKPKKEMLKGASGEYSFAVGIGAMASGYASMALGQNTLALGHNSVALGWNTRAAGVRSFAQGNFSEARAHTSVAMGYNTIAITDQEFAIGAYNTLSTITNVTGDPKSRLLVIGNGGGGVNPEDPQTSAGIIRSDAFTVLRNGKTGINIDNFEATPSNAKLQVNGAVKISSDSDICNDDNAGTIRFVAGTKKFQGCTGTEWKNLHD